MLGWLFGKRDDKRVEEVEESTRKGFENVRRDFEGVGKWIKHLDSRDKQLFDVLEEVRRELENIKDEIAGVKDAVSMMDMEDEVSPNLKQPNKKAGVLNKQRGVYPVEEAVQTAVQTGNIHQILQSLSTNERLIIWTLLNSSDGMKLSYEDIARLLGKERATIRGQINAIKQKSEGLLSELTEPSGKKRIYIPEEVRVKLLKYAKVRVKKGKKGKKKEGKKEVVEIEHEK